ncbi:MAG: EAL domain-containing protein [Pirellulales bacterium]|nr:EAL domain-containing protein [Pirellulales bacterium]
MQTQLMRAPVAGVAWLERFVEGEAAPETIPLEPLPFTLGRSPACDLAIDSAKVSREHAVIHKKDDRYHVEDLGSTNGTLVNGQPISEAVLGDGDVLVVADVQFTFFSGRSETSRATATQVLDLALPGAETLHSATELILGTRRLAEALAHRAIEMLFRPVVDLGRGRTLGYVAGGRWYTGRPDAAPDVDPLLAVECRLTGHVRRLERMLAVEAAADWGGEYHLFTRVDASEVGDATLGGSLVRLRRQLPARHQLVVQLPECALGGLPDAHDLPERLRGEGIQIATSGLASAGPAGRETPAPRSDYLILEESLLRQMHRQPTRRRGVETAIRTARETGTETVALGIGSEDDAALCRELGCRFVCGDHVGPALPRPADRHSALSREIPLA